LTYQNKSTLGIAIQYPFNWKRIEADHKVLIFLPPSKKDAFSEKLTVAVFGINSSVSTAELSSAAINNYGQQYKDFFIINSKPITLGSNPAYILSYTYTDPGIGTISATDIGVKDLDKVYIISYSAQLLEYQTYVSSIQKMIESFHVIST
jgi:eukaryotic-like serine/threonine-protein kinase